MIAFNCPNSNCQAQQCVPPEQAGKMCRCVSCGQALQAPLASENAAFGFESGTPRTQAVPVRNPGTPRSRPGNAAPPKPAPRNWHYEVEGRPVGPVPDLEIRALADRGELSAATRVWTAGMAEWRNGIDVLPAAFTNVERPGWGVQRIVAAILSILAVSCVGLMLVVGILHDWGKPVVKEAKPKRQIPSSPPVAQGEVKKTDKEKDNSEISLTEQIRRSEHGSVYTRLDALTALANLGEKAKPADPHLIPMLDAKEDELRRGVQSTLSAIGLPLDSDAGCIDKALAAPGKNGRIYAMRYFSPVRRADERQLREIIKALEDDDPAVRSAALQAIDYHSPDCKVLAFDGVLKRVVDPEESIRVFAEKILDSFGAPEGGQRQTLIENLTNSAPGLRRLSMLKLSKEAPDLATALKWFEPGLKDQSAGVREVAIAALANNWGVAAKRIRPAMIEIAKKKDEDPGVQLQAILALGKLGSDPASMKTLQELLNPDSNLHPNTGLLFRRAAILAILEIEITDPKTDLSGIAPLLGLEETYAKAGGLNKIAKFGPAAKPLLPQVIECLKHPDESVQREALKVVAAIGVEAGEAAQLVYDIMIKSGAGTSSPLSTTTLSGEQVYARLLKSTVFIAVKGRGYGSGVLVHKDRRLVITNYHVVGDASTAIVFFPAYAQNGDLIPNTNHYFQNAGTLGIRGTVRHRRADLDLAVVELDRLPEGVESLPLSKPFAATGSTVYSLGGSGVFNGALWRLSTGTVRGRHPEVTKLDKDQTRTAMVLETQSPTNQGDSGGPTVNSSCELVGLVSSGVIRADLVSQDVDLSEIRKFLEEYARARWGTWNDDDAARRGLPAPGRVGVLSNDALALHDLALVALDKFGSKTTGLLFKSLTEKLPNGLKEHAIEIIGSRGREVDASSVHLLFDLAKNRAELRPAISKTLGRIGGEEVTKRLRATITWTPEVNKKTGKKEIKYIEEKDLRLWAMQTFGMLDPKLETDEWNYKLFKDLNDIVPGGVFKYPDPDCLNEAVSAFAKLKTAGLKEAKK